MNLLSTIKINVCKNCLIKINGFKCHPIIVELINISSKTTIEN